jgi:hypothetical protein
MHVLSLASLPKRGVWQTWSRDTGGWTFAIRFHDALPLVKISLSQQRCFEDDPYGGRFASGRVWVVESHRYACDFWGEAGEPGLGMGPPFGCAEFDEWDPRHTGRHALQDAKARVMDWLREESSELRADWLATAFLNDGCSHHDQKERLWRMWCRCLSASGDEARWKARDAMVIAPYIQSRFGLEEFTAQMDAFFNARRVQGWSSTEIATLIAHQGGAA